MVSFADNATGDSASVDSTIAAGQSFTIQVNGPVASGDQFVINFNGIAVAVTYVPSVLTNSNAEEFAQQIAAQLNALDPNGRAGTVTATGPAAGTSLITLSNDGSVFLDVDSVQLNGLSTVTLTNTTTDEIIVTDFDGRNNGFSAESIVFFGRDSQSTKDLGDFVDSNANSRSTLATAKDSGGVLNGKDTIVQAGTTNTLIHGQDLLIGGKGNDTINGLGGNDIIFGSVGTDSVDGGAGTGDKLFFDETLIGPAQVTLTLPSASLPVSANSGTVTVKSSDGATTLGTTTFVNVESIRTFSNTGKDTVDASGLSNLIATFTTTTPTAGTNTFTLGTEGVVANYTAAGAAITYNFDANGDGALAGATEVGVGVVTAAGFENLTTGNANDSVTVDNSQNNAANVFNLGAQGNVSATGEGADTLTYTNTLATVKATLALTGLGAGSVTVGAKDSFTGVEVISFTGTAAGGTTDLLDASGITGNVLVNFGPDITLPTSTGGGNTPADTVTKTENNTFETGVSLAGTTVGAEQIEIGGITSFEQVTTGAGNDTIFVGDTLLETNPVALTNVAFASKFGTANNYQSNDNGRYTFNTGTGTDTLDYGRELGSTTVVVSTVAGTPDRVLVDGNSDGDLLDVGDRVDIVTNTASTEQFFAAQGGANAIDLTNANAATTTTFNALTGASEVADPLGNAGGAVPTDQVRAITVATTATPATTFATLLERTDANTNDAVDNAFFLQVVGSSNAETVSFSDKEDAANHTLTLAGGANVVDYTRLSDGVTVTLDADTGVGKGANTAFGGGDDTLAVTITKVGGVGTDTVSVIGTNALTVKGNTSADKDDTIAVGDSAGAGAAVTQFTVNLATGAVTTAYDSNSTLVFSVVDFENVTVSNNIKSSVTGDGEDNTITTGTANDTIDGGAGADTINANDGANSIVGGDGADTINSGTGNDTVSGGAGDDSITSGDGNDLVDGGANNDIIIVGNGNDTVTGGTGGDTVTLGAGVDVFKLVSISDGAAADTTATAFDVVGDFLTGTDRVEIESTITGLEVFGTVKSAAANGFDGNTGGIFVSTTSIGADAFGTADFADVATAIGTIANFATNDEHLFIVKNDGGDSALFYFKNLDGNGTVDAADTLTLISKFTAQVVAAGDINVEIASGSGIDSIDIGATKSAAGSHILVYDALADSTAGNPDNITGFDVAADFIDLSAFTFTGADGGTPGNGIVDAIEGIYNRGAVTDTAGEVFVQDFFFDPAGVNPAGGVGLDRRVAIETEGTNTRVFVDLNQNGDFDPGADLVIDLVGVTVGTVTFNNFVFTGG